MLNPTL